MPLPPPFLPHIGQALLWPQPYQQKETATDSIPERPGSGGWVTLFHDATGEPLMEIAVVRAAIEPVPIEVDKPFYDEATGEQTGSIKMSNPDKERDDEERAAAQTVVDNIPTEVIQISKVDAGSTT